MDKMNNGYDEIIEKDGFVKDENNKIFDKIFSENKVSEINIDTYIDKPFMLFSRMKEKNVITENINGRIIFSKSDRYKTRIVSILFDKIENCIVKQYASNQYEFYFNLYGIHYRILVIV